MIHPLVVREDLVNCFKYWDEEIQEGMSFKGELYTRFRSFSAANRLDAYGLAYEQIESDKTVCVTVSETRYVIWVCLRKQSPVQTLTIPAAPTTCQPEEITEDVVEQIEVVSGQALAMMPGKKEPLLPGLSHWPAEHPRLSKTRRRGAKSLSREASPVKAIA